MIAIRDKHDIVELLKDVDAYSRKSLTDQLSELNETISYLDILTSYKTILRAKREQLIKKMTEEVISGKNIAEDGYDEFLSIPQVAKKLKCSPTTVHNKHVPNGLKTCRPTGPEGHIKVKASDLKRYIDDVIGAK